MTLVAGLVLASTVPAWKQTLQEEIPLMGAGNWVCVVDSSFPALALPGIKLVSTGQNHIDVLRHVARVVGDSKLTWRDVSWDAELLSAEERLTPGATRLRNYLSGRFLSDFNRPIVRNQDDVICVLRPLDRTKANLTRTSQAKVTLDRITEAAKQFRILILKTQSTVPNSSAYIEILSAPVNVKEPVAPKISIIPSQRSGG